MADVSGTKKCPRCGKVFDRRATICPNGHKWRVPAPQPRGAEDPAPEEALEILSAATTAVLGASVELALVLPDGVRVPIPEGRLEVGRECGTEAIEEAFEPYEDVSRRHAVINRAGDGLLLIELKETYGTEVDGQRLAPFVPMSLPVGARIKLGSHCYVTVEACDGQARS